MMRGKVLITGASGFIGSRLRSTLVEQGADVVAIARRGSPPAAEGRSVTADYANVASLQAVLREEKPDTILHVAGVTKGRTYQDFQRGNAMPTQNLLAAAAQHCPNLDRFVHVSSLAAYGPADNGRPVEESDRRNPVEYYGRSKLEAEQIVEEATDVPWTIVRPAGVYGPGDVDYFNLFKSARQGWNVFFGNRNRRMSTIYVDDCVGAILQAAQSDNTIGKGYFLTDPTPVTWDEFQSHVVDVTGNKARTLDLPEFFVTLAAWGGELLTRIDGKPRLLNRQKAIMSAQHAWTCSAERAAQDFGFRTQVPLAEGIAKTHGWYAQNDWY